MKREILHILIIFISSILMLLILVQKRGSALSSGEFYPLRRGLEKKIYYLTIFFGILFGGILLFGLLIK
ncbi:preprotein translocase subunit SecG [Candidatus Parcubacteria bacterium]|nr:preprotein translocase subunit SecG [Candidatus Parcubacteria bacterium]